jgi:hypothetical protein
MAAKNEFCVIFVEGGRLHEKQNRMNAFRDVINEHKELIARPIVALIPSMFHLFSLPLFIASFSLGCQDLETNPLRPFLITCYFISFIPQMLTFLLYIRPSTVYSNEWRSTAIAIRLAAIRSQFSLPNRTSRTTCTTKTSQDCTKSKR